MARGLQIIRPDDEEFVFERDFPPEDHVIISPRRQLVVEHQMQSVPDSEIAPIPDSENHLDVNANDNNQSGSHILDDFPIESDLNPAGDLLSFAGRSNAPSLQETRTTGQILFTQFCRQQLPDTVPLEVLEEAIPEEVPQEVNHFV